MVDVIAVFGISGVGKSWLISRFAAAGSFHHVTASQLLRDAKASSGQAVSSEELRVGPVLDNQALLVAAFEAAFSDASHPMIFDGHSVVDDGEKLVEIPVDVIAALRPSGLVFVHDDPDAIVGRRRSDRTRSRPDRSREDILAHQEKARALCLGYADHLRLELHEVKAGDEAAFAAASTAILRDPGQSASGRLKARSTLG